MGLKCTDYFDNSKYDSPNTQIITCRGCSSHLCLSDLILSDNFNGSSGPAFLVENLINIIVNPNTEDTHMKTGLYKINKIKCHQCLNNLGWYYKKSYSYAETYKEGKFVIEKSFIKFSDNLSTTQLLKEKAMQSKYRRFSNSSSRNNSTISVEADDSLMDHQDPSLSYSILHNESLPLAPEHETLNATTTSNTNTTPPPPPPQKIYNKTRRTSSSSSSSLCDASSGSLLNRLRYPYRNSEVEIFTNNGVANFGVEGNEVIHEDPSSDDVFIDT
ncbi:uncharacterized protein LODBEIA_P51330 [Lodderomyces beijingensis]|uniref:Yippee domain-containing protein n=1 Tax=Lodderomyces beijingensis TaxID=1775926 RepID=A0ABP0ZSM0_9ASCO